MHRPADLRARAEHADASQGRAYELGSLWLELSAGGVQVVDGFCTRERCYLVLRPIPRDERLKLPVRERILLERSLLGESEKVLAFDHGVSVSTVAGRLATALRGLGLDPRSSRVPVLLAIAIHVDRAGIPWRGSKSSEFQADDAVYRVVSAARPDRVGLASLTRSERHVVELLVEGNSPSEIATVRRTSVRTIANQIAAVFHKTGVSGRRSLLSHLVRSARATAP